VILMAILAPIAVLTLLMGLEWLEATLLPGADEPAERGRAPR
jgi:hypothetical protein